MVNFLIAFSGGVLGAALGGLNGFGLCGLSALVGTVIYMSTGDMTYQQVITWGPFLGPHVVFAGGLGAAAYAAKRGFLCSGRNVLASLYGGNNPSILIVGGLFGLSGYIINLILSKIKIFDGLEWTNTIGLSIVFIGFAARLLFGKTGIFGKVPEGGSRWRLSRPEEWQPWPSHTLQVLVTAVALSILAGGVVMRMPQAAGLLFGISAMTLFFFHFGARIPVTLHIILSAELAVLASGSLLWGVVVGVLAAYLCELFACLFLIHGDTHIDPPAMSLGVTFTLVAIVSNLGLI
ncbi:permease [bacterium]|nr:permease [bacterium]